jgi:hypothetical protein
MGLYWGSTGQRGRDAHGPGFKGDSLLGDLGWNSRICLIGGYIMNAVKIAAIVLIFAGVLGLAYGSFSYTKETQKANVGPIELSVKEKQTVNVPVWAGVGAIVVGGVLLVFESKKS